MPVQCPECKATLDDPSAPCEWCGHAPPGGAATSSPPKEVDPAPPPPNYAEQAKVEPLRVPKNEPPRITAPSLPRPKHDSVKEVAAKVHDAITAPPPPAPASPAKPSAAPSRGLPSAAPPTAEPLLASFPELEAPPGPPPAFKTPRPMITPFATPKPAPSPLTAGRAATPIKTPEAIGTPFELPEEIGTPFEIPPLPPGSAKTPAPAPSPLAVRTPGPIEPSGGLRRTREQILDGDELDAPLALEVDMGRGAARAGVAEPATTRAPAAAIVPVRGGLAPLTPELDPVEIRMVARFGVAPEAWWATPSYVRSVRARQAELVKEITTAEDQYLTAKGALDDALVSIGQRAIAEVRNTARGARGQYQKAMDRVVKRDNELKSADAALYAESEKHRETMRDLFDRIEETKKKLAAAARDKDVSAELASLQQERDATERALKMPARSADGGVERARTDFRAMCADFATLVLEDRATFSEDYEEPRARVARLRNTLEAAEMKIHLLRAAPSAFDEKAMATGIRVMYGGIGLAVLSLVIVVLAFK